MQVQTNVSLVTLVAQNVSVEIRPRPKGDA